MVNGVHVGDTVSCISLLRLAPQCSTFSSYLIQCFQALVHSQSISQCRGSRISNSIPFKTVEESTPESVQVVLITTRLKNIKNVKGCTDGMPKSMQTR